MNTKAIISLQTKLKVTYWFHRFFSNAKIKTDERPNVWFFLAADYGNLGDVAITYAQTLYLKKKYPQARIHEIPISQTLAYIGAVRKAIKRGDTVCLVGGGNMSDLYPDIEFLRRLVVNNFRAFPITSFPQTVYFTPTAEGQAELVKTQKAYSGHPDLTLVARDEVSLLRLQTLFPTNIIRFAPDIVLTLDKRKKCARDKSVLFCLRNDKERKYSNISAIEPLKSFLDRHFCEIHATDTQIEDSLVRTEGGEKHLNNLLDQFSHSGIVVTDRLHGMILAFITGTPALVFDNSTKKISATYGWIKNCGFIHLVDEHTDFDSLAFEDNYERVKRSLDSVFEQNL